MSDEPSKQKVDPDLHKQVEEYRRKHGGSFVDALKALLAIRKKGKQNNADV